MECDGFYTSAMGYTKYQISNLKGVKCYIRISLVLYITKNPKLPLPVISDFFISSSYGNRTRVSAVRGRRLDPLTNEPQEQCLFYTM